MNLMEKYLELQNSVYSELISIINKSDVNSEYIPNQKSINISFIDQYDYNFEEMIFNNNLLLIDEHGNTYSIDLFNIESLIKIVENYN